MRRSGLCFFFSSRRRHTRLQGDWSSDVCSSDLHDTAIVAAIGLGGLASVVSALTMPSLVLLTAQERMDRLALQRVTGAVLSSAITLGVLLAGGGVVALLAGSLAVSTLMWLFARALAGAAGQIGRASWRERGQISGGAVSLKQ